MLNQLEHFLLSSLCQEREQLHALYADATRELEGVTLQEIIAALLKLLELGCPQAFFYDEELRRSLPRPDLAEAELRKHCACRSPAQLQRWPAGVKGGEYFFGITQGGRAEEAREIYAPYYPDPVAAGQS